MENKKNLYRGGCPLIYNNGDIVEKFAENDKFAKALALKCINNENGYNLKIYKRLWDMNILGQQVEWAYTYCGSNTENFIKKVMERDSDMINNINLQALVNSYPHKAIKTGALRTVEDCGADPKKLIFSEEEIASFNEANDNGEFV